MATGAARLGQSVDPERRMILDLVGDQRLCGQVIRFGDQRRWEVAHTCVSSLTGMHHMGQRYL